MDLLDQEVFATKPLEVFDNGEAFLSWEASDPDSVYASLLRASWWRPDSGWSPPELLRSGDQRVRIFAEGDNRRHIFSCSSAQAWRSWVFEAGVGWSPSDRVAVSTPGTHPTAPWFCDVLLSDGILHGFYTTRESNLSGAPNYFTYVDDSSQTHELGTFPDRAGALMASGAWAALYIGLDQLLERAADGTWQEAAPLIDAIFAEWNDVGRFATFSGPNPESQPIVIVRNNDGWEGPFLAHSQILSGEALSHGNGDLTVWWTTADFGVYVQRRVAGVWYAEEFIATADDARAAVTPAGDLVFVLATVGARDAQGRPIEQTITVHAKGPSFP